MMMNEEDDDIITWFDHWPAHPFLSCIRWYPGGKTSLPLCIVQEGWSNSASSNINSSTASFETNMPRAIDQLLKCGM
jgi:hypothetical protein